ncbi:FUSC family protein [Brucella gallinifaecis]|uniref:FUSC family protein n=1 Tax=Brucella gallinifaecis TaxID=215590 RepID=A0A502BJY2_9HYPH|nr:FUSC family protein [Brucella gallinifaecis]TPF74137.1 FUSC family protein [Brucella gallinifaecis]
MMATSVKYNLFDAIRETLADLAPFPGRMATAWRVAAVCALVAGIAMMFHIPESAISCYLVIFLMKADGAENTIVATAAIIAITLLVALMVPVLQWTIESALLRILVMIIVSFVFIFLGAASKLGEGGSIVALIIAFILSLINEVPINGVISLALRYAWEMAILPMFVIAGFSLFFGRWSVSLLRDELRERLLVARNSLLRKDSEAKTSLQEKLAAANDDENKRSMLVKILHQTTARKSAKIQSDIPASYQLLFATSALPEDIPDESRQHYAQQIDSMVEAIDQGTPIPAPLIQEEATLTQEEKGIVQSLRNIAGIEKTEYNKGSGDSFFAADAFTNPVYQRFALKTTLAAILCYMFYAAINWQGIHTAMVTCYVASMGTAGDTIHKLALRIGGCLIGAAIGIASLIYLMPQLESVGGLMVLVFAVALVAAWVAAGSEKISYGGVQIGLAFTLTVLQGFGPTTDMDTARDRIIGILVGNFAVYIVSTLIWPAPVATIIRQHLSDVLNKIAKVASVAPDERMKLISTAAETERLLGEIRYCFYLLPFEPAGLRPSEKLEKTFRGFADQLASLNKEVYFSCDSQPGAVERLNAISMHIGSEQRQDKFAPKEQTDTATGAGNTETSKIDMHLAHLEALLKDGKE